jgi:hypothetical protein
MDPDGRFPEEPPRLAAGDDAAGGLSDLDGEWDEAFVWSYGRRFWNVGCG